ncbi:MAG: class I SAM-dependent methyltransferase [Balneolaceae bacterium]|nr:class I SAM-dependent methyltransferase [Balneolaceae bacterium]MBO6546504.1 class I SAM-dependent methyltransferase [Balneolaceae bacterium]MBO6648863.1 class I SAM-dependent methyltransferase [Balneolaceae bacterium]
MIPTDIKSYYRLHSKFYDATRWVFLFGRDALKKYFPELPDNPKILDVGCGTGKHLVQLQKKYPNADITGIDLSGDMLSFVNHKNVASIKLKNELYSENSFKDNEFDLILCSYSLTMVDDLKSTFEDIQKHLKPNGLVLVVDFDSTLFTLFSKWMKKNHVSFEPNLFKLLDEAFEVEIKSTRKAYFGLYSYSIFLGKTKEMSFLKITDNLP